MSNFKPQELDSDDFSIVVYAPALDALQSIRDEYGKPIKITSAYRNPKHNKRVGGRPQSSHLKGYAFDIAAATLTDAKKIEKLALKYGFTAIGRYPAKYFIHIDMRPPKASGKIYQWGRWP